MHGYAGRILYVDLTHGKVTEKELSEGFARKYIGGNGFGARLLYDENPKGVDPFSPENTLILAVGPFAGTIVPTGSRYGVFAKSPQTGFFGESYASGFFGFELKCAGYDAVVIKGKAERPCFLWISEEVRIVDASDLWGLDTVETAKRVKEKLGVPEARVISIGPAGENLVRFACIINDDGRAAGRTGMGAVMGSKNLKAVAAFGHREVSVHDLDGLVSVCKELYRELAISPGTKKYRTYGTPLNVLPLNALAALPSYNWRDAQFDKAEAISGEVFEEKYLVKKVACACCPIACDHICQVRTGKYAGARASIDYELIYSLGSACGVGEPEAIIAAIEVCDRLGMDGISAGLTVSFAMECYERGILTKEDLGGLDARFGNSDALIELLRMIAWKRGIGKTLAEGTKRASEIIGKGSERYALHVKGLELPGYDIRGLTTADLGFCVSTRGGCHLRSGAYSPDLKGKLDRFGVAGKGKFVKEAEDVYTVYDSLILCKFTRAVITVEVAAELYRLLTGFDVSVEELVKAGERIYNLEKAFNVREGAGRKDDYPPPRVMEDPIPSGVARGHRITKEMHDKLLDDYYRERGWDGEGRPTREKLLELGLEDVARDLWGGA